MKKKILFNLIAIILGVILIFGFNKISATEITSVFNNTVLTRENISTLADTIYTNKIYGVVKERKNGDFYQWNLTTDNNGRTIWKVVEYESTNSKTPDYSNFMLCLNATRGFQDEEGMMSETKDIYNIELDMRNTQNIDNILKYAGGSLEKNYNKIVWIADNAYIATNDEEYQNSKKYIALMEAAEIEIDKEEKNNLNEHDIEAVEQMAIWYFTNESNSEYHNENLPNLYLNGQQLSSIIVGTDEYGKQITGALRATKADKLYKYFIENADENYTRITPTLEIVSSDAKIEQKDDAYILGPYSLNGINTDAIQSITVNANKSYDLLNSSKETIENNNFIEVLDSNFYLKVLKSEITETTNLKLNLTYKYIYKDLTFTTDRNDYENTQPILIVIEREGEKQLEFSATIEYIPNKLNILLYKVDDAGNIITSSNAVFEIIGDRTISKQTYEGKVDIDTITVSENNFEYIYTIKETKAPTGYIELEDELSIKILGVAKYKNGTYEIDNISFKDKDGNKLDSDKITAVYDKQTNSIIIKVANKPITGTYNLAIRKIDENGNILKGAKFDINGTEYDLTSGEVTILDNIELFNVDDINFIYTIKEIIAPQGYQKVQETLIYIRAKVQKNAENYKVVKVELTDKDGNIIKDENVGISLEGNTIVISVKNIPIEKKFDLALRKFITQINDEKFQREPVVDTTTISTKGTATYKHTKKPLIVQKGDIVTYTIRVYNEGELDGYVEKITDYLPEGLLPITVGTEGIDEEKYSKEIEFNLNWGWINSEDGKSVTTMKTSKINSDTYSMIEGYEDFTDTKLNAYEEGSDKLDYIDVQIKCLVVDTDKIQIGTNITNIAEITESQDVNGIKDNDIDSTTKNVIVENLNQYKQEEANNSDISSYIAGQEDDDDFEKIIVQDYDLALKKFITKVNENTYSREPQVDTSKLGTIVDEKFVTTATYKNSKEPVIVETGDVVTYTIRVYNEGSLDGFANEITDNIPEGLEFLTDSEVNELYKWKMIDSNGNETTDVSKAVIIVTNYLSKTDSKNIIKAVSEQDGTKILDYRDVQVQFKVTAIAKKLEDNVIINEAQISEDSNRDRDSEPSRNEKYNYAIEDNEDDIDYETIKLQYFDLALRKFITKVNSTDYNNRYPEIVYNEDGSISYNQTKDPVIVTTDDVIIYTIRIYNEGQKAGFATEIVDDLPEGLEFILDNEINKSYGWKLVDAEGKETDNVIEAKRVVTNILEDKLINGLIEENGQKILSYEDVKIAFRVTETEATDRIIVNTAEISKDSDDDVDSVPDNQIETEDDLDKEYIKVQYFDLSLKKWVTETIVTLDGKTTTTKTGFNPDSEEIAKVDIVSSKLKKTSIKFKYSIKVTNEGEIPGYAYEIKDYIPSGLKFVAEDNKNWKEIKDNIVVTDQLKDTLLNPGESATVEIILTWKNASTNLGLKTNYAEISEDSGDDIDSTPDNFSKHEDDIDDAQVMLSIKTSGAYTYTWLVLVAILILAGGVYGIKKYVLK